MLDGIDISKHQMITPDLTGLSFAWARVSYGTTLDAMYIRHMRAFREAGLVAGAYHFGVGWASPAAQADIFLRLAAGADLLALDLERDSTQTMTLDQAREFVAAVQATGRKIGLYHSRSGFPDVGQDWNWVAQWSDSPPTGLVWAFWQYGDSPIDHDKFNGDATALARLVAAQKDGDMQVLIREYATPRPGKLALPARSFAATTPFAELAPVPAGQVDVDAEIVIDQAVVPHGTFVRIVTGLTGRRIVPASAVVVGPDPQIAFEAELVSLRDRIAHIRQLASM